MEKTFKFNTFEMHLTNDGKSFMTKKTRKCLFSILFLVIGLLSHAQVDSSAALADSILQNQQNVGQSLLKESDSLHLADSLAQASLLDQIAALRAQDEQQKAKLQGRLDSLKQVQNAAKDRIKREVDSLRSGTLGIPVIVFEDTLFNIHSKLGAFSPSERAQSLAKKIEGLVDQNLFDPELLVVETGEESADLVHGEVILLSLNDRDAFWLDLPKEKLAESYRTKIIRSIESYRENSGLWFILKRSAALIVVIALFYFILRYLNKAFFTFNQWILKKGEPYLVGIKIRNYEILSKEREEQFLAGVFRILRWFTLLLVIYLSLPVVFSIFPATQGIASKLLDLILSPIKSFFGGIISYIPDLITIIVIGFIARYVIRFLAFLSKEVEEEKLQIPGFYPDWALPTFNLLKIIVIAFTFVIIFPYLPGSDSDVFKGVSVFLGLLISLGSSSAIGNIIAGLVITYMRAFRIGDRVKIGDTSGEVLEKTMLVTRVRTIKNEDVTIPNSAILNGSTINYSSSAKSLGLILNTSVTIGYDVPWREVHKQLIGAALKTDYIKKDPQPFVLQTGLEDFYVSYQINAYTDQAEKAASIYSQLHAHIQDAFNEAGIEILSPHYRAARDGNRITIPNQYLDPNYMAPGFNVNLDKNSD